VLFRSAHHSATLELELLGRHIPFVKYGGLRFFESAHVKDLLALLRWADNPRARLAAFRVLRLLPGLGPVHANRLLDSLDAAPDPHAALAAWRPPAAAATALAELAALVVALHASADWPRDAERALAWYLPQLERLHEDPRARRAELELLVRLAALQPSRSAFLTELALDPPAASSDDAADPKLDDDTLVLSTIHSAKGREWSAVYLLNAVDGCIPSDMATASPAQIDEERRLLHVAMTRARDHLELYAPLRFHVTQQRAYGDRHVQASPSRFLTPAVMAMLDFDAGDAPQPPPPRSLAESNGFPARADP
jgi:DNA helicase-2/ATP-dependent DNA helicase PcrA